MIEIVKDIGNTPLAMWECDNTHCDTEAVIKRYSVIRDKLYKDKLYYINFNAKQIFLSTRKWLTPPFCPLKEIM